MTDNIIATERKTNHRQYNRATERKKNHRQYNRATKVIYCLSFVFLFVAIILSVICFSFCGYYIVCQQKEKQMTESIIATERKINDRQYNSHRKKNKSQTI
jgi:uncharacterized protein YneF (UPF0154 family)